MNLLRQSTSQVVRFGPFLDSTDGVTAETGLTIAQADMQLSKDGAAFAQKNAAGTATHDTDGWYSTTLSTTDTATNGILLLQVAVAGALPVWHEYYVVPAATYDALTTNGLNNLAATAIVSAGAITTLSGAVVNVDLVDLTTTNTDMRGTDGVDTATMRGTDGANTVVPDAAGTAPTAVENRQEMDSNSVDLNTLVSGQTTINNNVLAIPTTAMRGTDGANTVVPDAAGTAPTAVENRQEMDSNSTQLASIKTDTGTNLPGLIDDLAIKKNTAFPNFEFLMVLASDHATPATALTVTAQRSIDGAAFTGVGGAIAEISNGIYQFDALAADTNGDVITWRFLSATADDTFVTFKTVA
ncbi:MAG: hypothetical protein V3V40_06325 [Nitrosomonadaceae bacterium]